MKIDFKPFSNINIHLVTYELTQKLNEWKKFETWKQELESKFGDKKNYSCKELQP